MNGIHYTDDGFKDVLKQPKGATEVIVSNDNNFRTIRLDYHDGEKYPHLIHKAGTPALLDDILKPLTPSAAATTK